MSLTRTDQADLALAEQMATAARAEALWLRTRADAHPQLAPSAVDELRHNASCWEGDAARWEAEATRIRRELEAS